MNKPTFAADCSTSYLQVALVSFTKAEADFRIVVFVSSLLVMVHPGAGELAEWDRQGSAPSQHAPIASMGEYAL